jgi:hypothetical protein
MSNNQNGAPVLAGLEAEHLTAKVRAELLGEVLRTRRNLKDQEEIAAETVARFRRRVARAEFDALAAGIDLTTVPAE